MKREKYTWKEFAFDPIVNYFSYVGKVFLMVFGFWQCEKCFKLLSPRTKKFNSYYSKRKFCSKCNTTIKKEVDSIGQ